jgi:hypothetical protein
MNPVMASLMAVFAQRQDKIMGWLLYVMRVRWRGSMAYRARHSLDARDVLPFGRSHCAFVFGLH